MASPTSTAPPMSVQEITKKAEAFEFNPTVPLRYWLRTADTLKKEALIYEREGNDQQAYFLLFRHAQLVLEHLSKHPDVRKPETRAALDQVEKALPTTLEKLEALKPRITKRQELYQKAIKERELRRSAILKEQGKKNSTVDPTSVSSHHDKAQDGRHSETAFPGVQESRPLASAESRKLAVRMAQKEIKRREKVRRQTARRLEGLPDDSPDEDEPDVADLQQKMRDTRLHLDATPRHSNASGTFQPLKSPPTTSTPSYNYPSIPKHTNHISPSPPLHSSPSLPPPTLPPKAPLTTTSITSTSDTSTPPTLLSSTPPPPVPSKTQHSPPLPLSRTSTPVPSALPFPINSFTESSLPLRTLFIPPPLVPSFLTLSAPNTALNLETCGILAGALISNALWATHLLIPPQTATADTCDTTDEAALFAFCDARDLLVLGWIHTHPRQDCFMSSRDLHTQAGYQVMMAESVAIVLAPSKQPGEDRGCFRLTDPPGLQGVLGCRREGVFHPHDNVGEGGRGVYTGAMRPGHVVEGEGMEVTVVDLRKGKGSE